MWYRHVDATSDDSEKFDRMTKVGEFRPDAESLMQVDNRLTFERLIDK